MGWPYQQKPPMGWPIDLDHPLADFVGYWPMLAGSGNTVQELRRNGKDGIITGAVWASGEFGHALEFNGGDRVDSSESSRLSGSFTFLALAKSADWRTGGQPASVVVSEVSSYSNYWAFLGGGDFADEVQFALYNGSQNPIAMYRSSSNLNRMIQIVGVRDVGADTITLYIDGILRQSAEDTTAATPVYNALNLGQMEEITARDLHGQISHAIIWNRALSASEIALLYSKPFCMFKDPAEVALLGAYQAVSGTILPQITSAYMRI